MSSTLNASLDLKGRGWLVDLFRREVDQFFMELYQSSASSGSFEFIPNMDVYETDSEVSLSIELAGVDENMIDVSLSENCITVSGEKKAELAESSGEFFRGERSFGSFYRTVSLPFAPTQDNISARFANGVLKISIKKPDNASASIAKIPIQVG